MKDLGRPGKSSGAPEVKPHFAGFSPSERSSMTSKHETLRLRVATYNVHKCQGMDGRTQPERIASVLRGLKPDVVALQEVVGAGPQGIGQEQEISDILGMKPVLAPARILRGRFYGNALLSRWPIQEQVSFDISQDGREPRFCQRVDLVIRGQLVHFYNVHLGTSRKERTEQARKLIPFLSDPGITGPKILLGDFNEWIKGPATDKLSENFQALDLLPFFRWPKTYPGIFPIFHIDQIYYQGHVEVLKVEAPRNWSTLIASDHMPLLAELQIRLNKVDPN
jgi:endonuclease/exonuclease/phosphatase family metal-dependent hydrolase